jgi:hypothetical protein
MEKQNGEHHSVQHSERDFHVWLGQVSYILDTQYLKGTGLSWVDLADVDYARMFELNYLPEAAAYEASLTL